MIDRIRLTQKQYDMVAAIDIDVDKHIAENNVGAIEEEIGDFVIGEFDEDYEHLSEKGLLYEHLHDDIYMYNEYEDYQPKFV